MHNTEFDTLDRSSALAVWRQGDFALEITEFVNIVRSPSHAEQFAANIDENVKGLVVVSQTCDIVNDKSDKDWVVVCPLVEVSEVLMDNVNSGRTPGYAPIKNVPKHNWAADLSRMMTVTYRS